jgi:poly(3-hydroxybutyrate) depolymerase/transglutaminase-like putative cysteine protease
MKKTRFNPNHPAAALAGWLALAPAMLLAGDHADWQTKMRPITPKSYLCQRAGAPIVVDGNLDGPAWAAAPWTDDFVDIQGGAGPAPRFRTRAKLLWDEDYLYIGAELEEPHVWATLAQHDSVIFQDPDFEVFIDPGGATQPYYELEMNALNTTWDLLLDKPYMDQGKPHNEWEIPGLKTAVRVLGTVNDPRDTDQGWTVELALPWKVLSQHARHAGPPREGEQWRIDFSRVEWQITTNGAAYKKVPNTPEDNWVWSPPGVIDMHRPEMWGLVQFTSRAAGEDNALIPIPGKPARDLALGVYYAQRDFRKAHARWATAYAELDLAPGGLPAGVQTPALEPTPDGYVCSVGFKEAERSRVWRIRQDRLLGLDQTLPVETEQFVAQAAERYGDLGRRAAYFLVDNMPAGDRAGLSSDFLMGNLSLALEARQRFAWAKVVPERVFFNDVLPYASLDEPRDPWRAQFYPLAAEIVGDCKTATEAAQALNRELFNRLKVHYNTARKRNNQSPKESIEQGRATCTGLAIILVDACRAVGVPARIAGVPKWVNKEGNHTWVEIWDGDWFFTGADEYDKAGLNRGWFNGDAARTARSPEPLNQVYASSWRRTGRHFPLAWDLGSRDVPAVNVSPRYAALAPESASTAAVVHVRLRAQPQGERLAAGVELRSPSDELLARDQTRAGTADFNDMPDFNLPEGVASLTLRFLRGQEAREKTVPRSACANSSTLEFVWGDLAPVPPAVLEAEAWFSRPAAERGAPPDLGFSGDTAARLIGLAWNDARNNGAGAASEELAAKQIVLRDKTLKWLEKTFGDVPAGERSLWITLHGGGQAAPEVNEAGWRGYFGRYELPPGSINVAPRAPADTWNMWHIREVDELLDRLIADMVAQRGVDPGRVYLIGYSAGGDGVYQLAPRLADRFAAAAMCAGHPNDAAAEGLRNLPFLLYMGGEDSAYHRNTVVREFSAKLDALQAADPEGYAHRLTVYPGLAHNMQGREAEMIPRMSSVRRTAWPKRVVWRAEHDPEHARFYWLERGSEPPPPGTIYAARVQGQTILIQTPAAGRLTLRLSDALVDLDKPILVTAAGRTIFEGKVARSFAAVLESLRQRQDPETVCTAALPVAW